MISMEHNGDKPAKKGRDVPETSSGRTSVVTEPTHHDTAAWIEGYEAGKGGRRSYLPSSEL
jgi:hypothetical protein